VPALIPGFQVGGAHLGAKFGTQFISLFSLQIMFYPHIGLRVFVLPSSGVRK